MPEAIQSPSPLRVKNPCVHTADHADVAVRTHAKREVVEKREEK
jgi:hypothetical protein